MSDHEHQAPPPERTAIVRPFPATIRRGAAGTPALVARALDRLADDERCRFTTARDLLAGGGGVKALAAGELTLVGLGVYEALLARTWEVRHSDADEMVGLARAAVEVARDLDPDRHGAGFIADLQARAWGELANACRVAYRLAAAERAIGKAFARLRKGSGDPLLLARLLDLHASLLGTSQDYDLAFRTLALLTDLYQHLGEAQLAAGALVKKALYTFHRGDAGEAIRLNQQAMALLDRQREPELWSTAAQNQVAFLAVAGRFRQARTLRFEHRPGR